MYEGIPHLMAPVVTEPAKAVTALKWTVREMERRYRAMSQLGVRNIGGYNDRVADARAKGEVITRRVQTGFDPDTGRPTFEEQPLTLEFLPFIVVVVDEMADLMMVAGKDIEARRDGRACAERGLGAAVRPAVVSRPHGRRALRQLRSLLRRPVGCNARTLYDAPRASALSRSAKSQEPDVTPLPGYRPRRRRTNRSPPGTQ